MLVEIQCVFLGKRLIFFREQKCTPHTLAAQYSDRTAFVPRVAAHRARRAFYVIGAFSYYIKKQVTNRHLPQGFLRYF